jgi:hypothetical protein
MLATEKSNRIIEGIIPLLLRGGIRCKIIHAKHVQSETNMIKDWSAKYQA